MSIFNDYRRYGTDEEREEWMSEVKSEYAKEQWEMDHPGFDCPFREEDDEDDDYY